MGCVMTSVKMSCATSGVVSVVLLGLYAIAFDVWTVPTDDPMLTASIEPTLSAGDLVVVTRHGSIDRGNLVRCIDPQEPGRFVIARAIAKAGDQITRSSASTAIARPARAAAIRPW